MFQTRDHLQIIVKEAKQREANLKVQNEILFQRLAELQKKLREYNVKGINKIDERKFRFKQINKGLNFTALNVRFEVKRDSKTQV